MDSTRGQASKLVKTTNDELSMGNYQIRFFAKDINNLQNVVNNNAKKIDETIQNIRSGIINAPLIQGNTPLLQCTII